MTNRITFDPQVMGGQACIRGMRIPVATVVKLVASRLTIKTIQQHYPDLTPADIHEALRYVATHTGRRWIPSPVAQRAALRILNTRLKLPAGETAESIVRKARDTRYGG